MCVYMYIYNPIKFNMTAHQYCGIVLMNSIKIISVDVDIGVDVATSLQIVHQPHLI